MSVCWKIGLLLTSAAIVAAQHNKVLLISMDGFRWDYLSQTRTPNFDKFIKNGAYVERIKNAFATITFPNHWTIVTGVYEEDHGIIANKMYDPLYDDYFSYSPESKWYNDTEPVWITVVREGLKSGAYKWAGNTAVYDDNVKPTKNIPYISGDKNFTKDFDIVLNWLTTDNFDFVAFYMDEPDQTGHKYGPNTPEVLERVRKNDAVVGYLMKQVAEKGLKDKLNVIITADHGMGSVSPNRTINLTAFVDFNADVKWSYISLIGHILPKEGKLDKVYNELKAAADLPNSHFQVYKKEDVPEELHYSKHRRIQPIVLIADYGWIMQKNERLEDLGKHGWNNTIPDMNPLFMAQGPDFKSGYKQDMMQIFDIYPLICELLKLKTCHEGPGERTRYENLLLGSSADQARVSISRTLLIILFNVLVY